jgi:hypothetical protein
MTSATLIRRASVALTALTLACGDSTGPANLSEEQVGDMLEAMSTVSYMGEGMPGTASTGGFGAALQLANATVTVSETAECPNGGSASYSGTVVDNEDGSGSAEITQTFSDCAGTSAQGRVWTFNSDPSIVTEMSFSFNESTGAFSMTASQVGGIRFASDLGSGRCDVDVTFTMSGTQNSLSASVSGQACGRSIQRSITVSQ